MQKTIDFDLVADLYDAYVPVDFDIPFYKKFCKGYGKILELMCGTGRVSLPLLLEGHNLTCVDYSQGMLDIFRSKLPEGLQAKMLCQENGALLMFDEVQCGMGRTGRFLACQHYDLLPDVVTLAKALGGGFPIGAVLTTDQVASAFQPGDHASTFGGSPLACTVGLAAVELLLNGGVMANATTVGAYMFDQLREIAAKHDYVAEVRGKGLLLGMELNIEGQSIVRSCQEKGLLINCVGGNVLRFIPPLIITKAEADQGLAILSEVMGS